VGNFKIEEIMDKVFIKNILARGIIGVNDWERKKPQDIIINIDLYTEPRRASVKDDIAECVDYSVMTKKVIHHAETSQRFTVEALAEDLAQICLEDPRVLKTTVRVEKPGAVRFSQSAGVEIERSQKQH
jgi:FolB domain-containing protein